MDQRRFDDLTRLLGASGTRRGGLRAALGGLLGVGAAALDADADARGRGKDRNRDADADRRKRRKRCTPACAPGQTCRKGTCVCDNGGTVCGAACCLIGQACEGGQCVTLPAPGECIAAGQPCKATGRACCGGRVCASGQGGTDDIACYAPKTGACQSTADCVYGMSCQDGRCAPPAPAALAQPCSQASQQLCVTPGAVCTDYTGPDAPGGAHCTLPLRMACTGDPDCTCYHCDVVDDLAAPDARDGRTSDNTKACCLPIDRACAADQDCCRGLSCTGGVCAGPSCIATGATGCDVDGDCCAGNYCDAGTCRANPATCDVYPTCPTPGSGCWTSIVAAYEAKPSGSTIFIEPATYDEPQIRQEWDSPKSMSFRRCGPTGVVLWRNANPTSADSLVVVDLEPDEDEDRSQDVVLSFTGIDFDARGTAEGVIQVNGGVNDNYSETYRVTLTLTDCRFDGQHRSPIYTRGFTDLTAIDCAFTNASLDPGWYGGGINTLGDSDAPDTVRAVRCRFIDNVADKAGGAIMARNAWITLVDCEVSGNQCRIAAATPGLDPEYGGGAVYVDDYSKLSLEGSTTLTGNSVPDLAGTGGSGVVTTAFAIAPPRPPQRMNGVTSARVTGNTPAVENCSILYFPSDNNWTYVPVSCDTWCLPTGTVMGYTACSFCCSGTCNAGACS